MQLVTVFVIDRRNFLVWTGSVYHNDIFINVDTVVFGNKDARCQCRVSRESPTKKVGASLKNPQTRLLVSRWYFLADGGRQLGKSASNETSNLDGSIKPASRQGSKKKRNARRAVSLFSLR